MHEHHLWWHQGHVSALGVCVSGDPSWLTLFRRLVGVVVESSSETQCMMRVAPPNAEIVGEGEKWEVNSGLHTLG